MKIIDLSFCNQEYAQAETYTSWKNYSDWNYGNQRPVHSVNKVQCERIKKLEPANRNAIKQVDYVHVRVKKSKHHNYKKDNYNNSNITINSSNNIKKRTDENYGWL